LPDDISQLSVAQLLAPDAGASYLIPMYQRNYAWREGEITQLIRDIADVLEDARCYYIGTLVVFEREGNVYETIDGQQRLTTLFLLACHLRKYEPELRAESLAHILRFENRPHSDRTLAAILDLEFESDPLDVLGPEEANFAIVNGYNVVRKVLPQVLAESGHTEEAFARFFFREVQIMRVGVPPDTDLNHYFEIMNSRGEQLEKHEVLKSRLLEVLGDAENAEACRACLNRVWEVCANMERYVQMGFRPGERAALFGRDWNGWEVQDFDALCQALAAAPSTGDPEERLDDILLQAAAPEDTRAGDTSERFNTVIGFPNFLLHVLRVQLRANIPLDDKRLLKEFDTHVLKAGDAVDKVKAFTFALLRCKYLLDQYVLKREFARGKDSWSLKRLQHYGSGQYNYVNTFGGEEDDRDGVNRQVLMVLSAFHVSTPTQAYKHWLNGALHYLYERHEIEARPYLSWLESFGRAMVFDRFLTPRSKDYFEIIYVSEGECETVAADIVEADLDARLSYEGIQNNLIFNYLDYLLWLEHKGREGVGAYEFTFRSSVEHYYPQRPMPGIDPLPRGVLDAFGNLCLISHEKNSRLGNLTPAAKRDYYLTNDMDSVKQFLMMECGGRWGADGIREHGLAMKRVLLAMLP